VVVNKKGKIMKNLTKKMFLISLTALCYSLTLVAAEALPCSDRCIKECTSQKTINDQQLRRICDVEITNGTNVNYCACKDIERK
jgi:hypothetical protein